MVPDGSAPRCDAEQWYREVQSSYLDHFRLSLATLASRIDDTLNLRNEHFQNAGRWAGPRARGLHFENVHFEKKRNGHTKELETPLP